MENLKKSFGWIPDMPDFRDFTLESPEVAGILAAASIKHNPVTKKGTKKSAASLGSPTSVDLREWCSPIEDQGQLGSCTANAGVGMMEYFQYRAFGIYLDASRLFLYKVTRNLLQWTGDTGAYLRTTIKALAGFGVCPETYWPYSDSITGQNGSPDDPFEIEPSGFCYAFAGNYKATTYYRLDPPGTDAEALLTTIKNNAAAGLPCMFGFTVYSSYNQTGSNGGKFPYPKRGDAVVGGHAVMVVGYDDNIVIENGVGGPSTMGALLIRNSWGTGWGMGGYGYLPYQYVLGGLAEDFWSVISAGFFDTNNF